MKLSTKCRYGLRSLVDLAIHGRHAHVALHQIASRQDLSLKYLEQEFAVLRKAGIVRSVKGAQGGYTLARAPSEYTLAELVEVLEGDLSLVDISNMPESATPLRRCIDDHLWQPLNLRIRNKLNVITLADLVQIYENESPPDPMYFI